MAGTFNPTGTYSNLTRIELEQLRRGDFTANGKALTIGDSGLLPEGVVGPGSVNAEKFTTNPLVVLDEVFPIRPPTEPGRVLGKLFQITGQELISPEAADIGQWYGPDLIYTSATNPGFATAPSGITTPGGDSFVDAGVTIGDTILIGGSSGGNSYATALVASVNPTTLSVASVKGGAGTGFLVSNDIGKLYVIRQNAVQLFAVPGSGPLGQEQTFCFCRPQSTLHSDPNPSDYNINVDRIRNIIPPRFLAWDGTVDRADAVFPAPAPNTSLTRLGYRVVLYPDDGTGTGPDLTQPIAALNPVIDPSIPADDQRMTIDYTAGLIRFSCAPALGGDIKVAGGVNATTGRLNLYAVFWAFDTTLTANTAQGLYVPRSTQFNRASPARMFWDPNTQGWVLKASNGISLPTSTETTIRVTDGGPASSELRIWDQRASVIGADPTLVQKVNGGFLTAGDGNNSFGDLNTNNAIEEALTIWQTYAPSVNSLTLFLKHGSYLIFNNLNLPAGKELILKGEGRGSTQVVFGSPGFPLTVNPGAQLTVEDLTFVGSAAPLKLNGSFRARRCRFQNTYVNVQAGAAPYTGNGSPSLAPPLHVVDDCEWYINDTTYPLYVDLTGAGGGVAGFHYTNCVFRGNANGNPIIWVENTASSVNFFKDLFFTRCRIELGCVTSGSSSALSAPSGVMNVTTGNVDRLTVTNINFIDCDVSFVNVPASGNTVLLHLMPVNWDATDTSTNRAIIGKVRISGGTWQVPARGSDFTPFFLQCQKPIVQNVEFRCCGVEATGYGVAPGFSGNGEYTAGQRVALRGSTANVPDSTSMEGNCAAFATIAASGSGVEDTAVAKGDSGLVVRDVNFNNCNRQSGYTGVLLIYGPNLVSGLASVDGININAIPGSSVSGQTVNHWMTIVPGGTSTNFRGTKGLFRNITFAPAANTSNANDDWFRYSFLNLIDEGRLVLQDLYIAPTKCGGTAPTYSLNSASAIQNARYWGGAGAAPGGNIHIRGAYIENVVHAIQFEGGTAGPYTLKEITVRGAETGSRTFSDGLIILNFTKITGFEISGCDISTTNINNTSAKGIVVIGTIWARDNPGTITDNRIITDCSATGNQTTGCNGISVLSVTNGSNAPRVFLDGNQHTWLSTGGSSSPGQIRLQQGNGSALPGSGGMGGAGYTNHETGHVTGTSTLYEFTDNVNMVRNRALLRTP